MMVRVSLLDVYWRLKLINQRRFDKIPISKFLDRTKSIRYLLVGIFIRNKIIIMLMQFTKLPASLIITNSFFYRGQGTGQWHRRYTKLQLLYQPSPDSSKPLQLAMGSSIILESHEYGTFCFVRQLLMRNALPDQRILP